MTHYDVAPLPGYHPEIGLLLSTLEDSTREWRENFEDVPSEGMIWQPAPGAYSTGALILHLIDTEDYWFRCFVGGQERDQAFSDFLLSEATNQYAGEWPVPPAEPLSWYLELHDRVRKEAVEALRGVEPDRVFERKNYSCTTRWVVAHVIEHDSYTGGQAVAINQLWQKMR